MNRILLTLTAICSFSGLWAKEDYASWWQSGNNHYQQKNYDSAAYYYNLIAVEEPADPEVYYNLGNTYYRLNNIGSAVLNYERALKIDPSHQRASDNLFLAQSRINNRIQDIPEIFFVRWWDAMTKGSLANLYAVIAIILFLLLIGYYIGRKLDRIKYNAPIQLSASVILICVVFIGMGVVSAGKSVASHRAIVMTDGSPLMLQPKYGQSQSQVPEGTKVEICGEQVGWYEVTLPDGRTGWLESTSVAKI